MGLDCVWRLLLNEWNDWYNGRLTPTCVVNMKYMVVHVRMKRQNGIMNGCQVCINICIYYLHNDFRIHIHV